MKQLSFNRRKFLLTIATITCATLGKNYSWDRLPKFDQIQFANMLASAMVKQGNIAPPLPRKSLNTTADLSELKEKILAKIVSKTQNQKSFYTQNIQQQKLISAISLDFEQGKLTNVDGWYISQTEYLVFSYLSRFS